MIGVMAFVAVASWKILNVLGWVGGREVRHIERWFGGVLVAAILIPIYASDDIGPLMAVVEEITEPIKNMVIEHLARSTR